MQTVNSEQGTKYRYMDVFDWIACVLFSLCRPISNTLGTEQPRAKVNVICLIASQSQ